MLSSRDSTQIDAATEAPPLASRPSRGFERALMRWLMGRLGLSAIRMTLWDGEVVQPGDDGSPTVHIRDPGVIYRIAMQPSIGLGECYAARRIEVDGDLLEFLERAMAGLNRARDSRLARTYGLLQRRPGRNTLAGSRDHIHRHYDLGNDFYRMWLDERMLYTCAYYPHPQATLEEAQVAKMDHVCRKLLLEPGQRVLELGCGWGSLALHMAREYGVRVRAFNISEQQVAYAREQARKEGLEGQVEFILDDYRNATGSYERVVSVGMLEHVGVENYRALGGVIDRCLRDDGLALVHSIGRNARRYMDAWIEKRIFPGAYPPSLREMMAIFEPFDFSVLDVENLRLHYARTCADWLRRFERHMPEIRTMFDDFFIRTWRLYLAGSSATFTTGGLQLFQVLIAKAANNDVPLTRASVYVYSGVDRRVA